MSSACGCSPANPSTAEITVSTVAGRVPVIVNVSSASTDQAIALARHAEKIGADAVLALPPYYWAPQPEALFQHFAAIASSDSSSR